MKKVMTREELNIEIDRIENEAIDAKHKAISKYCFANNPYQIGDIFEDHIGKILIEKIRVSAFYGDPYCIYFGFELKKDGTPRKDGSKRWAHQTNDINKP